MAHRLTVMAAAWGAFCLAGAGLHAEERRLGFDAGWEIRDESAGVESYRGQQALRLGTGRAVFSDLAFQDGTIELDVAPTSHRAFVYLQFRVTGDGEYEEIYLRPHKSALPDALQYTPVFRGVSQWQLFHGPGATAAVPLPGDEWTHVRVELRGRRAAVYVGETDEPQLVVPRLGRDPQPGGVALRGFLPAGTPATYAARFANLVVREGDASPRIPAAEPGVAPEGTIARWELSSTFRIEDVPVDTLPGIPDADWSGVSAEPEGFVMVDRFRGRPEGRGVDGVVARVRIRAPAAGTRRLLFGFSDWVSVFLDGELLFTGAAPYSPDAPRREGLLTPDDYGLPLPLREGDNELAFVVSDVFGGWGFSARLPEGEDLVLTP